MRAPSEDLFRLVKAMNKGEKRNFKLLAGMLTGDKKYIDLFDQIDKQTEYDESKILKSGISKGRLSVAKNYLFKFLLKSLVYQRSDAYSEAIQLIEQVRILMAKHLFREAGKVLKKALSQVTKMEAFGLQLELLDLKESLLMVTLEAKDLFASLLEIQEVRKGVVREIEFIHELKQLHHKVKLAHNKRLKIKAGEAGIAELMQHPLVKQGEPSSSIRARLIYLKIVRKLYSYQNNSKVAAEHCLRLLETYQSSEAILESELGDYFLELSNLCTYHFRSGNNEESLALMERFLEARDKYKNSDIEFFQRYYILQMAYAVHVGDPAYGFQFIDQLDKDLRAIHRKIPSAHLRWLYYLIAYLHFMDGDAASTRDWLNRFFSIPSTNYLNDLPAFARLLLLLVLFDLKEFSLLETETTNVQRFLDRNGIHTPYEYEVVKSIRYLLREIGLGRDREVLKTALKDFQAAMAEHGHEVRELLNFELWLQYKLTGIRIADLQKEGT